MNNANQYKTVSSLMKGLQLSEAVARRVEIRSDLVVAIQKVIRKKNLTHANAAKISGIGRTVITALMNGNSARISTDRLIHIAESLGLRISLKVA